MPEPRSVPLGRCRGPWREREHRTGADERESARKAEANTRRHPKPLAPVVIRPGTSGGTKLRLKGKGMPAKGGAPAGDQLVRLKVVLPEKPDDEMTEFVKTWQKTHGYNPRHKLGF